MKTDAAAECRLKKVIPADVHKWDVGDDSAIRQIEVNHYYRGAIIFVDQSDENRRNEDVRQMVSLTERQAVELHQILGEIIRTRQQPTAPCAEA
jgi:hypothetical protein